MSSSDEQQRRRAFNEALARDVNELVEEVSSGWFERGEPMQFRCECADADCAQTLELTREEYETVRSEARRFVLIEGHEDPEIEVVVGHIRDHVLVEKTGIGVDVAEQTDPRS